MNPIEITPTPLTIITGFLGSGKTTLLNRILNAPHGLRVAVLVNDFGAINIDSQLIVSVEGETVSLANGCICCTIRDDLIRAVEQILARPETPEYIVVETSGVSDPLEVALSLRILPQIRIDSILTVIDAENVMALNKQYAPLLWNQIGLADILLLNKVDLVTPEHREFLKKEIRKISPKARILETTQCDVPMELILGVGTYDPNRRIERPPQNIHVHEESEEDHHDHDHEQHPDHSLVFSTWSWRSEQPVSYRAVRLMLDELPEQIYRAKGIFFFAEDPDRRGILHVVGKRVALNPGETWGETRAYSQFVIIGAHGSINADEMTRGLERCLAVNQPKSEVTRLAGKALDWLRGRREEQA